MTDYTANPIKMPPAASPPAEMLNIAIGLATCSATIAELNCGKGEHAGLLSYNQYYGFDNDWINIVVAKQTVQRLNTHFSMVDILHFQSDHHYQTVLVLGNLVTGTNLDKILAGWRADLYVIELTARPFIPANLTDLFNGKIHYSHGDKHLITLENVWRT